MASAQQWSRVIVLMPPQGGQPSDALKAEFAARDWFAVLQHDPYLAMAELCLRDRAQAARSAWGLQPIERIALVIVDAGAWQEQMIDLNLMVQAIERYLPAVEVWQVVEGGLKAIIDRRSQPSPPHPTPGSSTVPPEPAGPRPVSGIRQDSTATRRESAEVSPQLRLAAGAERSSRASSPAIAMTQPPPPQREADTIAPERITRQEIDMLLNDHVSDEGAEALR